MRDTPRVVAVVAAAVAQIVGSPLGSAIAGRSVGDVSDADRSLVTPAGWAFSIWGLIFAGSLAWAVYQALPAQREREVHRRTGWPLAIAFAGNAVWEVVFPLGGAWQYVATVLIFGITAATAVAYVRLQTVPADGLARLLPRATAGLLLGWLTVASVAAVGSAGVSLGLSPDTLAAQAWAVAALVTVAGIAAAVLLGSHVAAGPFAAAVIWGLLGIAAAEGPQQVAVAAISAAAVVLVALAGRALTRTDRSALLVG
ncbi:hypothetical protein O2W18_00170 [Modestobacter sp. VKM Ac-2983]|uniref:hypothetical protein n=1 Tax=Modestobacter sp. VKM Ac-2983 TaxID=3004137 RepID=UPI0022ABA20C|nr:hypothetical protein [Modestobacter sp. VKM Ac-2983]MCZ2803514.1 hypothetical protein [Modestobacter sp. VKM Ac-2983]